MRRLIRFALFGAVGFGIGGLLLGVVVLLEFNFRFPYLARWAIELLAFVVKGALGGMALGLALRRDKKTLALFGSGGFLAGGLLALFWEPVGIKYTVYSGITIIGGALGGAVLGLALRQKYQKRALALNTMKIIVMAVAGSLGILIGMGIASYVLYNNGYDILGGQLWLILSLLDAAALILEGVFGGAILGTAVAHLEKE